MTTIEARKLPNMNEFSPSVVGDLGTLLRLLAKHEGDRRALVEAIAAGCPRISKTQGMQRYNRANNVLIGMSQCALFDLKTSQLTTLANSIREMPESERNSAFAKHLVENCHGLDVLDVVKKLEARGESRSLRAIREELRARGFTVTENEGNAAKIRLWLETSGIIDSGWHIDELRFAQVLGVTSSSQDEWQRLTGAQRIFLLNLRHVSGSIARWINAGHVKELCLTQGGRSALPEGALRARVIAPLETAGWLEAKGKGEGRGGNAGEVRATDKLLSITAELPVEYDDRGIPPELLRHSEMSLHEIYRDLNSTDTYTKGLALELLAVRLSRDLGLRPVAFRKRGVKTQGAEVDLIADGLHLHYSRWMFQCKNTRSPVNLEDLAKEVGLAIMLKAHVVVIVTTGKFTTQVDRFARGVERDTPIQIALVDGLQLTQIRDRGGARLVEILKRQAREALLLKAPQVSDSILSDSD